MNLTSIKNTIAAAGSSTIKYYTSTTTTDAKRRRVGDVSAGNHGELLAMKPREATNCTATCNQKAPWDQGKDQGMPSKLVSHSSGTQLVQQSMPFLRAHIDVSVDSDSEAMPSTSKKPRLAPPSTVPSKRSANSADLLDSSKIHSKKRARLSDSSRQVSSDVSKSALFSSIKTPMFLLDMNGIAHPTFNPNLEEWYVPQPRIALGATDLVLPSIQADETKNTVNCKTDKEDIRPASSQQDPPETAECDAEAGNVTDVAEVTIAPWDNPLVMASLNKNLAIVRGWKKSRKLKRQVFCAQLRQLEQAQKMATPAAEAEAIDDIDDSNPAVIFTSTAECDVIVESVPKLLVKAKGKKRDQCVSTLDGGYWAAPATSRRKTSRKRKQTVFFTPC